MITNHYTMLFVVINVGSIPICKCLLRREKSPYTCVVLSDYFSNHQNWVAYNLNCVWPRYTRGNSFSKLPKVMEKSLDSCVTLQMTDLLKPISESTYSNTDCWPSSALATAVMCGIHNFQGQSILTKKESNCLSVNYGLRKFF